MHNFELRTRTIGEVTVVTVGGTLGTPLSDSAGVLGLIEQGARKVVLDLSGVPFLASSSIGKVIFAERKAKEVGAEFRLCCPEPNLREVFSITRLDQLLTVYNSLDEALRGF
jgi:anti-sigma B factor antagonist